MKISNIIKKYSGYTNRLEVTNTPDPSYMVLGSKNVILDWLNSLSSRRGFSILGGVGALGGVKGRAKWRTSRGQFYNFRKVAQKVQLLRTVGTVKSWVDLPFVDGTSFLPVSGQITTFANIFNDTRKIDEILFAGGNVRFFSWSGASGSVVSSAVGTITLDSGLGAKGFTATGNVYVNGVVYAYTGITGSQFTGVTPSAAGLAVGAFACEGVKSNAIASIPANFTCDYVGVYRNQAYLGSDTSRMVLVSSAINYTDFLTSTAVGGPRTLTFDDNCAGFEASKSSMVCFGKTESIFVIKYTISADQTKEFFEIERLATSPNQGVISPLAKIRVKNAMMYITQERTLDTVEFVENISDEQTVPISDLIKNDFDSLNFTGACVDYWQRNVLVSIPASNVCYMYDMERKVWQAPIVWNGATIGMFSVDENNNLIGHDAFKDQSYLMFSGTSDGGAAIESVAVFAYDNFGDRFALKQFTKYVQDGYISAGGVLTQVIDYDFRGKKGSITHTFSGSELSYVYNVTDSGGFGKAHLGERPLSGSSLLPSEEDRRFRFGDSFPPQEFYESRTTYSMSTVDGTWRLVAFGNDAVITNTQINDITRVLE